MSRNTHVWDGQGSFYDGQVCYIDAAREITSLRGGRFPLFFQSAYDLAEWLTRSREDAEDIVQEAFLRAFSAFDRLRSEDAKPWLLAIVRNTAMTGSSEIETRRPPSTSTKQVSD